MLVKQICASALRNTGPAVIVCGSCHRLPAVVRADGNCALHRHHMTYALLATTLNPSIHATDRFPSVPTFNKQVCSMQAAGQRKRDAGHPAHASTACTAGPFDYNLINSIILQQHRRAACVPAVHEQHDPLQYLVRPPCSSSSVASSPCSDRWVTPRSSDSPFQALAPMHGVPPRSNPVRFLKFEGSEKVG